MDDGNCLENSRGLIALGGSKPPTSAQVDVDVDDEGTKMAVIVVVRTDPIVKENFHDGYNVTQITDAGTGQQVLYVSTEDGRGLAEFKEWAYYRIS